MIDQQTQINLPRRYADQASVSTIREVFDYIRRFRNHIFVLKIEDILLDDPLFPSLMKDLIRLHEAGIKIIIIPGTRATIERNLKQAGLKTTLVKGVRITPPEILPHVKLAAMEVAENIISHLAAGKLNGIMGNWIKARSLGVRDGVDFQCSGEVEKIRSDIILRLLDQAFIPLIHPIGLNALGASYNLNSTQVACSLCMDIEVSKLFFIGEHEGIRSKGLIIPEGAQLQTNGYFSNLDRNHARALLEKNSQLLSHQEKEYLENAIKVTSKTNKVKRVHIISGKREGSLLKEVFSSIGGGTMIYANRHAHIRRATYDDLPELMQLLDGYVKEGNLVMRTEEDISEAIDNYYIYEVDKAVYGCGALFDLDDNSGEIGAIAVNPSYKSRGVGQGLVEYLIRLGRTKGFARLFLLTTRTSDWFYGFGFTHATPMDLPEKRKETYNQHRNSRVLMLLL
ncbi:Amino-acid acetyltransferase [Desulfamplus magnetovallimortis]|uniref:amino-acid N-acetyltransferase n=1 Tax=Desulfamplus magnetovallimortis TaxID=1246637 RepID=A0A1W1HGJ5_9BACT|nr:amino-acid N-acetyltransferase [Desulfamplus magnetovallimortis]SLM31508.1 Amino-acid acetyltransferase [Desulfamplus magnetovallimortis]